MAYADCRVEVGKTKKGAVFWEHISEIMVTKYSHKKRSESALKQKWLELRKLWQGHRDNLAVLGQGGEEENPIPEEIAKHEGLYEIIDSALGSLSNAEPSSIIDTEDGGELKSGGDPLSMSELGSEGRGEPSTAAQAKKNARARGREQLDRANARQREQIQEELAKLNKEDNNIMKEVLAMQKAQMESSATQFQQFMNLQDKLASGFLMLAQNFAPNFITTHCWDSLRVVANFQ